jgi:hypothetical protein
VTPSSLLVPNKQRIYMSKIWRVPNEYPESLIAEFKKENNLGRLALKKGVSLNYSGKPIRLSVNAKENKVRQFDDLANSSLVPLVSPALCELLADMAADEIELIETRIEVTDCIIEDYKLLNVCHRVEAVDKAASTYTCIPGTNQIMKFKKLTLRPDNFLEDRLLARESTYSSILYCADSLANRISKYSGVGIYPPEALTF